MKIVGSRRYSPSADDVVSTLPLYRSAPELQVRLEDFELFAIHRLRGLVLNGRMDVARKVFDEMLVSAGFMAM